MDTVLFDDDPPPEPRDGWLLVRIHVPELNVYKCLQFPSDHLVWDIKQQVIASLPKELKESFNYGLFCPPSNGKAGKFLDEERRLGDYPFNGPVGYLELKYKRRVYKMLNVDEKQLKGLHTRANLRRFFEYVVGGHIEKMEKMCTKGLDPNCHCPETGDTPLTLATGATKPNKILIALVNGGALLDYRTKDGGTALHKAVEKDSIEAVRTLLELGASPNYKDSKGLTPLYLSVTKKTDPKICENLLHDHGILGIQDTQGWQEVHQACRNGLDEHLEQLLLYGGDIDARNASGNTPLHVCAVNSQEACARILLFRGAHRGALNYSNQTPYQVAVIAGNLELAEIIQNYKSEDIDKTIGGVSDFISDSSGVETNSDSATCSIGHSSTTVVCMEQYTGSEVGHLNISPGDVIEVVGSTDCGLLEGYIRGGNRSGVFPAQCVLEVNIRQKDITKLSAAISLQPSSNNKTNKSTTLHKNLRIKKCSSRTVILHRVERGFGFILRGAKAASPLMLLKPSERCPGLQYLDDVDPGGAADLAGLRPGDFLLAVNGNDVRCASHEQVVDLIRRSGSRVTMTVVSQNYPNKFQKINQEKQELGTPLAMRQCSTLPRKMPIGKHPAPAPPRRDPKTTLSVSRAKAKSMLAGLENSVEIADQELLQISKSSSAESIHQQLLSSESTPTQTGPGTPIQARTASIKARPTSNRITSAELEELFQRQQGEVGAESQYSTMMSSSKFQSGTNSRAATPPTSPHRGPLVYASVAEMKRKKSKHGTLRGKPCDIPVIGSELKRIFHSTPNLATSSISSVWSGNANGGKSHRSQNDMHVLSDSMQRLNLPPPNHPPPPPPIGQVVKVEVSRHSEYDSTVKLQQTIAQQNKRKISYNDINEIKSSFKPASNAKLYASPQDIQNVAYRRSMKQPINRIQQLTAIRKCHSLTASQSNNANAHQYAQPVRGTEPILAAPPIPDPDYSLSESDDEDEKSLTLIRYTKMNEHTDLMPSESNVNSNTSGSSTRFNSIPHSFSVDEIKKIRVKLKSSKSYPNEILCPNSQAQAQIESIEEGDNSSSGVSSDQEITFACSDGKSLSENRRLSNLFVLSSKIESCKQSVINETNEPLSNGDNDSPSPPPKGFQRHNSMTRKQAATIAMNRAIQQSRNVMSLVKLPPPIEADIETDGPSITSSLANPQQCSENILLAPPPQFSDFINGIGDSNNCFSSNSNNNASNNDCSANSMNNSSRVVRIVGAVPK